MPWEELGYAWPGSKEMFGGREEGKAGVEALERQVHGYVKVHSPRRGPGGVVAGAGGGQRVWLDPEA